MKNPDMKFGLLTSVALIAYFLIMKYAGLIQIVELRIFNLFILTAGIWFAFHFKRKEVKNTAKYFNVLQTGIYTTFYAVLPFAVFVFIYFWKIEPDLVIELKSHTILSGYQFTHETVAEMILIEGLDSGALLSFIFMQYYRNEFSSVQIKEKERKR